MISHEKMVIIKKVNECAYADREIGASLIEKYLEKHPDDIDMLLRAAVFVQYPPIAYYPESLERLHHIFDLDEGNIEANLLYACIIHYNCPEPELSKDVLHRLSTLITDNLEILSMIEYVKAWFYDHLQLYDFAEKALRKSIETFPGHVFNYETLAYFYIDRCKYHEAKKLLEKAIKNVKQIYRMNDGHVRDLTSVQEFFDELLKGTHITWVLYESLEEALLKASQLETSNAK